MEGEGSGVKFRLIIGCDECGVEMERAHRAPRNVCFECKRIATSEYNKKYKEAKKKHGIPL